MKRLIVALFVAASALPVAADGPVVCSSVGPVTTTWSESVESAAAGLACDRPSDGGEEAEPSVFDDATSLWLLDEKSGTRADSIGSLDLTDNNTVLYANMGPNGVVASFAFGAAEYLTDVPAAITLGDTDWTIAAWVKPTASQASEPIFSKGSGGTNSCLLWLSTNQPQLYTRNFNDLVSAPAGSAPNDKWTYVVAYHDSVNNLIGISVDGGAFTTAATGAANSSNATALEVGGRAGSYFYDGNIARAAKWDRVLSAADALALYNSGVGKSYTDLTTAEKVGLVSYWNLDEASGNRADSHGSNTLTDNNTVTSATNSYPANLPGRVASFVAGNSEYLSLASDSTLDLSGGDYTFAFWINFTSLPGELYPIGRDTAGSLTQYFFNSTASSVTFNVQDDPFSGTMTASTGGGSVSTGTWYLVVGGIEGSNVFISLDGGAKTTTAITITPATGAATFFLGARRAAYGHVNGQMSAVAVWDRALSADDITALYNSGDGAVLP